MIERRGVLAGILAGLFGGVALPVRAEAPTRSLRPRSRGGPAKAPDGGARRLIDAAGLGGALCYAVADMATGQVLEAEGLTEAMPPASVAKTVTTLFALEKLGPAHRFETRVMRAGTLVGGRLEGDLVLAGGGDPTLDTDQLGDLVAALAASGLREVTGKFIAYAGALPQIDRISTDQPDHVGYNPAICGLILNFNRVHFEWKRAGDDWAVAMDARAERFVPAVRTARMQIKDRDAPLFTYTSAANVDQWTVAGSALTGDGSRWLPVRHPATYVAEVFAVLCAAQGIRLPTAEIVTILPAGTVTIVAHQSAALDTILRSMLKFSTNITAEVIGLAASGAGTLRGSAATMSDWARRRFGIMAQFGDHSGLGAASRISAGDMVRVMVAAREKERTFPSLLKETGLADAEGREVKQNPVRLRAKTGTLNFVSGLAGYVQPPGGRALAFAIFAADVPRRAGIPMADRERPEGGPGWAKRARRLQSQLLRRWVALYG